ncbi:MAG: Phosphoribosylglycinamide formyltransferase [Polaribacter sp. SA4-10]|nr:MAG: Phosphoribosylglycinamide formyltransferase [Polaribacter sp. SA4-10]
MYSRKVIMKRIIVFASGSGSNAESIINFFNHSETAKVTHVLCNNKNAEIFERCERLNVEISLIDREVFDKEDTVLHFLRKEADLIVLAGFLWKIPEKIVSSFPKKIINIHPSLLPKYGGKGMFGKHIHKAIKENCELETGITIHYVNEKYDEGAIIFQEKTIISKDDSIEIIADKIHLLEQSHFARVIESVILEGNE